jgi:hypothetical protein
MPHSLGRRLVRWLWLGLAEFGLAYAGWLGLAEFRLAYADWTSSAMPTPETEDDERRSLSDPPPGHPDILGPGALSLAERRLWNALVAEISDGATVASRPRASNAPREGE